MSDMKENIDENTGVVLSDDEILLHSQWANDWVLSSTSTKDAQSQLDGPSKFCSNNKAVVTAVKSKCLIFVKWKGVFKKPMTLNMSVI